MEDDPPIESNEMDEVLDTPNIKEPINSHQTKMDNDGKVKFLKIQCGVGTLPYCIYAAADMAFIGSYGKKIM